MTRFCYCTKVLQGKEDAVRSHWADKEKERSKDADDIGEGFWDALGMTGFESWLQGSEFYIHCLEGKSLDGIFSGLREQIQAGHPCALKLQAFYQDALGKDYSNPAVQPSIELLLDISVPKATSNFIKKGYAYPLLPDQEENHRKFCQESMGNQRKRHETFMRVFGVSRLTTWIQQGYIVVYSERQDLPGVSMDRLKKGEDCQEWNEVAEALITHTGLSYEELSPNVEWLTRASFDLHI